MFVLSSHKPGQKVCSAVVITREVGPKVRKFIAILEPITGKDSGYVRFEQPEAWTNCAAAVLSGEGGPVGNLGARHWNKFGRNSQR
ncbi:uncharacterized protein [Aristolochia californica]|uniref:uncharacterized protein isoform X7 n=1 Tax=Aristolochia californica TaxID=171875 RepID=UPI0035DDE7F9